MIRFLLVFLSVYSAMHVLVFFRIKVLLPDRGVAPWLLGLFTILMIIAPINTRFLEKSGYELPAQWTAFVGFSWMGLLFLLFCGSLLLGALNLFTKGITTFIPLNMPALAGKIPAIILIASATALWVYGYFEARDLRVERVRIETNKLPEGVHSLKIAQISDVHLGLLVRCNRMQAIADKIQSEKPDILVSTGDLVDGLIGHLPELSEIFQKINPPYGKYAITGNHEAHAGLDHALEFMKDSGFTLLRGEIKTVENLINIAGVDDPAVKEATQEVPLLSSKQNGFFTLFLKHRPEVREESLGLFDLQLSGHTHRGQIFPFRYVVARVYPLLDGYYELAKGSRLYTSRGTGTWGPPIRVFSPPEVTFIELVRKGL